MPSDVLPSPAALGADRAQRNHDLNRTHAMAGLRERGGRVVRWIEERRRRLVAQRVLALRPRTVVDVGCEDGWIAEAYAAGAGRVVLADLDGAVLARSRLASQPHVALLVADALHPEALACHLGGAGADVIVLSALLEHLPEPRLALRRLAPLLAPGGVFVVYVPADRPILALKRLLKATRLGGLVRGLSLEPAPGHVQVFGRTSLRRLLAAEGRLLVLTFDPVALGYVAVLRPRPRSG